MSRSALPGLSFEPGIFFSKEVASSVNLPVCRASSDPSSFAMLASFGRCKFRLDVCSVAILLQATIGGAAPLFRVTKIAERSYKFFVTSKQVGFRIVNRRPSFSCDLYSVFFHLWNDGGPNWKRELSLFLAEEARSWSKPIAPKRRILAGRPSGPSFRPQRHSAVVRKGASFADATRPKPAPPSLDLNLPPAHESAPPLTEANAIPLPPKRAVFRRLQPPIDGNSQSSPRGNQGFGKPTAASVGDFLGDRPSLPFCYRCLSLGHGRAQCMQPIRCKACFKPGHIAVNCRGQLLTATSTPSSRSNGRRREHITEVSNFRARGLGPSAHPQSGLRREMGKDLSLDPSWAGIAPKPTANEAKTPRPNTVRAAPEGTAPSASPLTMLNTPATSATPHIPENPSSHHPLQFISTGGTAGESLPSSMAYQQADPRPFIPPTFQWVDIPNREFMCRAVAPVRPMANNEDLAIVTFHPLPGNVLNFSVVRNIIRDCLVQHRVVPRAILPTHLGQAYVRFMHAYERDNLVRQSPVQFGDIQLNFVKHNEGRNWRRVLFTEECWFMILGFPSDYQSERHIYNAVSEFARILL